MPSGLDFEAAHSVVPYCLCLKASSHWKHDMSACVVTCGKTYLKEHPLPSLADLRWALFRETMVHMKNPTVQLRLAKNLQSILTGSDPLALAINTVHTFDGIRQNRGMGL